MRLRPSRLILAVLVAPLVLGNAPAPYWACEGRKAGDRCRPYGSVSGCLTGSESGICVLAKGCTDDPETAVDECLSCQD